MLFIVKNVIKKRFINKMENNYQNLIDLNKYQVFLFKSRVTFPFIFAIHPWFVLNKKGELSRWEVIHIKGYKAEEKWGHLYKNLFPLFQGLGFFIFSKKPTFKIKLIGSVEGDLASKMISFIENSPENYKHKYIYHFRGPNSNTFATWIINNFPDSGMKLPWNAFGKNYE
ncbi:MAG: hypothetical protein UR85_C0002G0025 [Candidatus Nomurabacteria bacterium GW2011_GWF2_35_66]|uniref:Uncharacterized protein n=1 Tax=Candidatus Nomurabacteria bacterium GW2011_GWE1_35_16 TaxID=1618761 RepID=A0A0G0DTZ3_9BACT|nr:MAG: hypothetical protein UR55_C0007G0017 [Candidatus Nomurabacteria bacterium GW2011_GWF1_34_20]KKP63292.1 MAG: hypothetical protein UR57_C0006G0017 [Candidatus Nomurabacteria bacterium GW2011_GWE2_34_25]KKP66490.1 MAG: hypothetical protein UR64_C0006G0017 [Candidatus Nomurabacteria bacterium GW2011_GWE1_35_16]KKP83712.1 MAG: hypothetical protein UR85_C0002G0025 [Candidatus Nomurabacteria bacterium GW2011_GWF2_35_66]HAE36926.1 hypothetical protein [Candidatus Nomurabacteria bacterium]